MSRWWTVVTYYLWPRECSSGKDELLKSPSSQVTCSCYIIRLAPLAYKVVIIYSTTRWPPMGLKPQKLHQYGKYVHHLLLEDGSQYEYLIHCPNITNLALVHLHGTHSMESDRLKALAALRLIELSIDICDLPMSPQLIPLFNGITHLDVAYFEYWPGLDLDTFSHFTSLTHLMIASDGCTDDDVSRITKRTPLLKVFVIAAYAPGAIIFDSGWGHKLSDPRVVTLTCTFAAHWQAAAEGLENPWSFAERVIARRQRDSNC